MELRRSRRPGRRRAVVVALIGAAATVVAAVIALFPRVREPQHSSPVPWPPRRFTDVGRVDGTVTDPSGRPLRGFEVHVRNGPATTTDDRGQFTLVDVPDGHQQLVVIPPSGQGQWTEGIEVEPNRAHSTKVIYDSWTGRMGLLSIVAPLDGGVAEVRALGKGAHLGEVAGRCAGLADVLGEYQVWVLVRSERDRRYWIQHPSALVDRTRGSWRARVRLGSREHPPIEGERWDFVATAVPSGSADLERIAATPELSLLPRHLSSNVVTADLRMSGR